LAKTSSQADRFTLIPILRVSQLRPRGLSEDNRVRYGQRRSSSALSDAHVTPLRRSSSSEARRRSSSASCSPVKGICSCSRLSQSCAISAKRSEGVKRTISSGVSESMLSSLRKKESGGKRSDIMAIRCRGNYFGRKPLQGVENRGLNKYQGRRSKSGLPMNLPFRTNAAYHLGAFQNRNRTFAKTASKVRLVEMSRRP